MCHRRVKIGLALTNLGAKMNGYSALIQFSSEVNPSLGSKLNKLYYSF